MMPKYITTGQAAALMQLCSRTLIRLFDGGQVRGFRIPGTQRRRMYELASVLELMQANNYPAVTAADYARAGIAGEPDEQKPVSRRIALAEIPMS